MGATSTSVAETYGQLEMGGIVYSSILPKDFLSAVIIPVLKPGQESGELALAYMLLGIVKVPSFWRSSVYF